MVTYWIKYSIVRDSQDPQRGREMRETFLDVNEGGGQRAIESFKGKFMPYQHMQIESITRL